MAAVSWLNRLRLDHTWGQSWLRLLISTSLLYDIRIMCLHVPGATNIVADGLTRYFQSSRSWFVESAHVQLHRWREMVEGLWTTRVVGGMVPTTRVAYSSGFNSLAEFGESMGWRLPHLGGNLHDNIIRLPGWIDHLKVVKGHPASTVDSYVTGVKQQLGESSVISEALGKARAPAPDGGKRNAVRGRECSD